MKPALLLPLLVLAACGTTPPYPPVDPVGMPADDAPRPIESDSIRYETGPCFGTCPVYALTVSPDGTGRFEGQRFTAVQGTRAFTVTPDQYRAFAERVGAYRPRSGEWLIEPGTPLCQNAPTDMPTVDVRWSQPTGASQHLRFYYGCDRDRYGAMAEALRSAPDLLGIQALIARPEGD